VHCCFSCPPGVGGRPDIGANCNSRGHSHASALNTRASIRQKIGDVTGTIEDLTALTTETPRSFQVWATRGILRMNKGEIDGALNDFNTVIALAPNLKEALVYRATIYFRKLANRNAVQDLNRAIDLDPSYSYLDLDAPLDHSALLCEPARYSFNDAISITNRYLTWPLIVRSQASLICWIGITSTSDVIPCSAQ
jgi:tetratricopeptide (TPR) repeat protein